MITQRHVSFSVHNCILTDAQLHNCARYAPSRYCNTITRVNRSIAYQYIFHIQT